MEANTTEGRGGQPKHRACDECRIRKLACSKEPDGCARCKREGITCNYSPQKPMGRPPKRRHVEAEVESSSAAPAADTAPAMSPVGMDLSFLNADDPTFNFLDLLSPGFGNTDPVMTFQGLEAAAPLKDTPAIEGYHGHMPVQNIVHDIDFDPPPLGDGLAGSSSAGGYHEDAMSYLMNDTSENPPGLSPNSSGSPGTKGASTPEPWPTVTCSCLANIYLALDSLQNLPDEIGPALKTTRSATKTAHDVILCRQCSTPVVDFVSRPPPIQAFQNMMMLAALLPSTANAYMSILQKVDAEAKAADARREQMTFSLADYGGLWGKLGVCGASQEFEGARLDPPIWRLTVRALLKVDVYGQEKMQGCTSFGLKDIVTMMEERSRCRHAQLDAFVAAGAIAEPQKLMYGHTSAPGERPTCMKILDVAKNAIEQLVIA